jgi:hypothetical protein
VFILRPGKYASITYNEKMLAYGTEIKKKYSSMGSPNNVRSAWYLSLKPHTPWPAKITSHTIKMTRVRNMAGKKCFQWV